MSLDLLTLLCFFLRLMVNLTQPAMLCFGKVPDDPVFRHHFLQVTSHLQACKEVLGSQYNNNTLCHYSNNNCNSLLKCTVYNSKYFLCPLLLFPGICQRSGVWHVK